MTKARTDLVKEQLGAYFGTVNKVKKRDIDHSLIKINNKVNRNIVGNQEDFRLSIERKKQEQVKQQLKNVVGRIGNPANPQRSGSKTGLLAQMAGMGLTPKRQGERRMSILPMRRSKLEIKA